MRFPLHTPSNEATHCPCAPEQHSREWPCSAEDSIGSRRSILLGPYVHCERLSATITVGRWLSLNGALVLKKNIAHMWVRTMWTDSPLPFAHIFLHRRAIWASFSIIGPSTMLHHRNSISPLAIFEFSPLRRHFICCAISHLLTNVLSTDSIKPRSDLRRRESDRHTICEIFSSYSSPLLLVPMLHFCSIAT